MRKQIFQLLIWLSGSLLISGCKVSERDKDIVVNVEPEFGLSMQEELGQVRDFSITFQTLEEQSCASNIIDFTSSRNGRNIYLGINEIIESVNCTAGAGKVKGSASYDYLPAGVYNLLLDLKNTITAKGTLTVSNEKFELEIEDGYGFTVDLDVLRRIPSFSIWGYVAYKDNSHLSQAQDFLSKLNEKTSDLELSPGEYGVFFVNDTEKLGLKSTPDYNNFKTFYRTLSGTMDEVKNLLEEFRAQYPNGEMEFKIWTWEGEML